MLRAIDKWLPGYLRHAFRLRRGGDDAWRRRRHLLLCVADHFEPFGGRASRQEALARVRRWRGSYPSAYGDCRDADGRYPRHTFFYAQEEYDPECLDWLAETCALGCAEVEVHLHHRNDTPDGFRSKLVEFRDRLRQRHACLGSDRDGRVRYGFVHGNWALCNSRPDGDWCGVNEELGILSGTGCYADFTYPSAPSPTQPRTVNTLYYARDLPGRPRGHDYGVPVRTDASGSGRSPEPDDPARLMVVQGPLALNWACRKWGILPRLENGEVSGANPPTRHRTRLWGSPRIGVAGRPEWVFVKIHTHGCVAANADVLLGEPMKNAHKWLQSDFNDGDAWRLHYVTAREMYNTIKAAEAGADGEPGDYRDFLIGPPPVAGARPPLGTNRERDGFSCQNQGKAAKKSPDS
ncbi:MAG: hypothetical protein JXR37_07925 [Kiritimatiellae bacterium]|nr:hypothetical protein [Kiritimatiellia bacterium]